MPRLTLEFGTLDKIDHARIASTYDRYLREIVRDCTVHPHIDTARKLKLAVAMSPINEAGELTDINVKFTFTVTRPGRSFMYTMIPGEESGIDFSVAAPSDHQDECDDLIQRISEVLDADPKRAAPVPQHGEVPMSLRTLRVFDGETVATLWDMQLRQLDADIRDRQFLKAPRSMHFVLRLSPQLSDRGELKRLLVQFSTAVMLPEYKTPPYPVLLGAGAELLFRPDSPAEPAQMTLAEASGLPQSAGR